MTKNARIRRTVQKAMRVRQVGLGTKNVPDYDYKRGLAEALAVVTSGMKPKKAERWRRVASPKR